jgi:hypothetical protein
MEKLVLACIKTENKKLMKIFKYKAASLVGEREIGLLLAKIT